MKQVKIMKQVKKMSRPTPPKGTLYFEIEEKLLRDYHDGKIYGGWEQIKSCRIRKASKTSEGLQRYNIKEFKISEDQLDQITQVAFVVVVTYSSGNSFGRCSGNLAIAAVFPNKDHCNEIKNELEKGKSSDWNSMVEKYPDNCQHYPDWCGYFERIESVNIEAVILE